MKSLLLKTEDQYTGLLARLFLGVCLFPHGAQKLLGWFGGFGFSGTMQFFTETIGLPWIVAFLVILIESVGAISLIFGLAGRFWAISVIGVMIGIIVMHTGNGFFMNWMGNQKGEGFEYHLLVIGLALVVLAGGSGKWSVDRKLSVI